MEKIENEFKINTLILKQSSPIDTLTQGKFSNFLHAEDNSDEISLQNRSQGVNIFMQSLQNKAQLNRMVIESVA